MNQRVLLETQIEIIKKISLKIIFTEHDKEKNFFSCITSNRYYSETGYRTDRPMVQAETFLSPMIHIDLGFHLNFGVLRPGAAPADVKKL